MGAEDPVLALERDFWMGGASHYSRHLAPDAVMVLPAPAGVLTREMIIRSVEGVPRWVEVDFADALTIPLSSSSIALIYKATAWRSRDRDAYRALCTSVYTRHQGALQLALHQQTPLA